VELLHTDQSYTRYVLFLHLKLLSLRALILFRIFQTDMFAFDLYDKDGSGELSGKEVTQMLQDIYGKKEVKSNYLART